MEHKSKEEILKPLIFQEDAHGYDCVYEEDALTAMEKFAMDQCVSFADWLDQNTDENTISSNNDLYLRFLAHQSI